MGENDVILDISDYIEPKTLKHRQHKNRAKIVDEFRELSDDSQSYGGSSIEVILDEESASDEAVPQVNVIEMAPDRNKSQENEKVGELGVETITEHNMPWLDLDDEQTFGDAQESEILATKDEVLSNDIESSSRLFHVLLSQFRRNPVLAGIESIQLQLGQDQVVEPVAVRRLITQVQHVLDVHEKYTPEDNIIQSDFFDTRHNRLSFSFFRPLVFDAKTIYAANVSANTDNDHTIQYRAKADILNDLLENFKHPPLHRGKKSYDTAMIYETLERAYVPKKNTNFEKFEAQTPIRDFVKTAEGSRNPGLTPIFSTEHIAQTCLTAARPESYLDLNTSFTVYRIAENVEVEDLTKSNVSFAVEKRQVSYPILQPQLNEDEDSLVLNPIMRGERICIVGFVVDWNKTLDAKTVKFIGTNPGEIERMLESREQFVVLCPTALSEILTILAPSSSKVFKRKSVEFGGCYNLEYANKLLSSYALNISNIEHSTVSEIREQITRNTIELIDYMADLRIKNQKALNSTKHKQVKSLDIFLSSPNLVKTIKGNLYNCAENLDDVEFMGLLKSIGGAEQLYCLEHGMQYAQDLDDVRAEIRELEARLETIAKQTVLPASFADVVDFIENLGRPVVSSYAHVDSIEKRIAFLYQIVEDIIDLDAEGFQDRLHGVENQMQLVQRQQAKVRRALASSSLTSRAIQDFRLSLNEESNELAHSDSEVNISFKYLAEFSTSKLPTYFLSPELRKKLEADSSIDLQIHFTAKPLWLLARQLNTMLHPNKLNCLMSLEEIKEMVYDISEMSDESFSVFERRHFIQQTMTTGGKETQGEAVNEWKRLVGGELDVGSQKRVAVILARLMLQLELSRPAHSFRKVFPIGGQKSIGRDSRLSFESYSLDNKFKYIVTVAAQTADLGREGRLMNEYQSSDLKNIQAYTTYYYDKFLNKPNLLALKAAARKTDDIQQTLLTEKNKSYKPEGYDLVQSEELTTLLLDRLEVYNVKLQTLLKRLDADFRNFFEIRAIQQAIRKKIKFLVVSLLASVQRKINELDSVELDSLTIMGYNPEKYGDEKSDACQPGEVCILATFMDFNSLLGEHKSTRSMRESENVLMRIKFRMYFVRFPRRNIKATYNFANLLSTKKKPISFLRSALSKIKDENQNRNIYSSPENIEGENSVMEELVELLAGKTGKDEHWRIAFSAKLSNLGRVKPNTSLSGLSLLQQFYRSLKKNICLLSNYLYVTVNSYEIIKESEHAKLSGQKTPSIGDLGDSMETVTGRGTRVRMRKLASLESRLYADDSRDEWDVLYYNKEDKYLSQYLDFAQLLKTYNIIDESHVSFGKIVANESAREQMHTFLMRALLTLCNFVLSKNKDAIDVADFCIEFLHNCFRTQDDIECTANSLQNLQDRAYEKYLKGLAVRSREKMEEMWSFRKVGIDVEYIDDLDQETDSAWLTVPEHTDEYVESSQDEISHEESREDFNLIDEENRMNIFNDDE